jgi:hypothetical protein
VIANIGAEEDRPSRAHPAVTTLQHLFALLFPAGAQSVDADGRALSATQWPHALGPPAEAAAYSWIEGALHAWLIDEDAAAIADRFGEPLVGASPDVVARVHDKAFTRRVCDAESLLPRCLRGHLHVFEPAAADAPDETIARMQACVDAWPPFVRGRFTLKPRRGGSGRGRVGGEARVDTDAVRRALPRMARRGGWVLEPWLERDADLSTQLYVAPDGTLTLLATFEQLLTRSGVYRGHRGRVDHRGRITTGTPHDDALLEAATGLARAAHAEGFHGPCGIDAFLFEGPERVLLQPAVELNARFTTGTVVAGLVRRAWPLVKPAIDASPGHLRAFHFGLDSPPGGWPDDPGLYLVPLGRAGGPLEPALAFAAEEASLERFLPRESLE